MAELYITFGVQYAREVHPAGDWVHPDGYLIVQYEVGNRPRGEARELARRAAWQWLNEGQYAFDYDEHPDGAEFPRGQLARLVLP